MGILDELLAGGQRQEEYSNFVDRYEQGHPSQGYSDQEVLKRYGEVSHAVSPDQYAQAAQEALSKLSPEERAAFVKMLQDRAAASGVTLPDKVAPEPKDLGQVLADLHEKPGQLRDMLGGGAVQPQAQAPCSRASRPWWSSASWVKGRSAAPTSKGPRRVATGKGEDDRRARAGRAHACLPPTKREAAQRTWRGDDDRDNISRYRCSISS